MKALLGMSKAGSVLDFLHIHKPSDLQIDHVNTKEQFTFRVQDDYKLIAVHCDLFPDVYPWEWLINIRNVNPSARVIIMLDDRIYDSMLLEIIQRLSDESRFDTLPIRMTEIETSERLAVFLFDRTAVSSQQGALRQKGKVVSVWSAASKDGASTIAINTAISLANLTELSVGLIDLNLKNPEIRGNLNITDREKSNVKLRPKLLTQTLEPRDLMNMCVSLRNLEHLHILAGSNRRDTAMDVTPEMVQHLLTVGRKTFDITIVDVHTFPDNAATICAVRNADFRWLVTQNNYASYKTSWEEWYDCYWRHCGIQREDMQLVVNRVSPSDKPSLVSDHMGIGLIAQIPNVIDGIGLKSVHEGVPLYNHPQSSSFAESINELVGKLVSAIGEESKMIQTKKKPSWIKRVTSTFFTS